MSFKRKITTVLILCLLSLQGAMAQVTFKIQAPRQAEVGQRIRVSYVANTTEVEDIDVGEFSGFEVLYGPSTSSSNSFSMVNGKTTRSSSLTFTYTIAAIEEGTHQLPVATIKLDGKSYKSNTTDIEILPASTNQSTARSQSGTSGRQSQRQESHSSAEIGKQDLFMTVTASKHRIYEQEAVLLTYKLHTLVNVQQISGEIPLLDGFHVQELDSKTQMSLKYERVNGRNYGTAVWRQYVLFPQKTGKLTVPCVTFESQVQVHNTSMDPFDVFFGGGNITQLVTKSIVAPAVQIEVLSLPMPKPDNFSGAVGKFTLNGTLTPQQLNANDAATLRLELNGYGNMKLMHAPKVDFPKDFDVYDPKEDDKSVNTAQGAKGKKSYDYIIVPRHAGEFGIAPVKFCYFDTEEEAYRTLQTDSFTISVAKAKGVSLSAQNEQEDLKVLSSDIRYIKRAKFTAQPEEDDLLLGSTRYCLYYAALPLLLMLVIVIGRKSMSANASVKGAGKAATKRLRNASKLMEKHQTEAFYEEVMRALLGYAGDKLNIPTAKLNKDNLSAAFAKRNVDDLLVKDYMDVLSECEFARFAPGDPNATMEKIFAQATGVINKLDAFIKKK